MMVGSFLHGAPPPLLPTGRDLLHQWGEKETTRQYGFSAASIMAWQFKSVNNEEIKLQCWCKLLHVAPGMLSINDQYFVMVLFY